MKSNPNSSKTKEFKLSKLLIILVSSCLAFNSCQKEDEITHREPNKLKTTSLDDDGYSVFFRSELFIRETGKPVVVKRQIGNTMIWDYECCFKLHVQSGINGEDFVSSATVKIDGVTILSSSDFNNSSQSFQFDLCNLTEISFMEVEINGTPGSTLEIWIDGKLKYDIKAGLISFWPIDETSGTTVYDVHGVYNCGVNNGVIINQDGVIGRAASFEDYSGGLTSGIRASSVDVGGGNSKSVSIWIKPDPSINGLNSCGIIDFGNRADQQQFGIKYWALPAFWMFDSWYGSVRIGQNEDKLADGIWHHIVVTYNADGHKLRTYLDGNFITEDAERILNTGDNYPFSIGFGSQGWFIGAIDEVGLWSRPLTDAEVQILYNEGAGLPYPFDL